MTDPVADAIRTRRTHKAFGPEPVPAGVLRELFELARWAPNHHLTDPWRFRVLGPAARERLKAAAEAAKPGSGGKLDRAPTLIVASARQTGEAEQDREDVLATAVASYIVLLAGHARGLAGYWRTLAVLDEPAGRTAVGLPEDETPIGLLHLGDPRQEQRVPPRAPVEEIAVFLDQVARIQDWPIKYLALIYGNREIWDVAPERRRQILAAVEAFNRRLADSGELVAVDGLVPPAKAVRAPGGSPVVSDGPYLEAKEHVGSYFIVDVASEERALEIAQSYPALGPEGGGIELWPLMSTSGEK